MNRQAAYTEDRHWEVNEKRYQKERGKETTESDFLNRNRFLAGRHELIEKKAAEQEEDNKQRNLSLAALGGGGIMAAKNRDTMIGMETRYHGTGNEAAENIKQNGLLANKAGDGVSTRRAGLRGKLGDEAVDGKVYLAKDKRLSKDFAMQAGAEKAGIPGGNMAGFMGNPFIPLQDKIKKLKEVKQGGEVLTARIPYKELKDGTFNLVDNPELRGLPKEEWVDTLMEDAVGEKNLSNVFQNRAIRGAIGKSYDSLGDGTDVVQGDVDSRYFKGGEGYSGQTLQGVIDYAKTHPGRFARGTGGVVGGLGIAGAGGYGVYDHFQKAAAAEFSSVRETMEKIAHYYKK